MQDHRRSQRYRICQMIRLDFGHEGIINAETPIPNIQTLYSTLQKKQ